MKLCIHRGKPVPLTESIKPSRLLARHLFDGVRDDLLTDQLIEWDGRRIAHIRPATAQDARDGQLRRFDIVSPGFIDLQINGAGDTQFNFEPNAQAIARIAAGARQGGTAYILPTFITAHGQDYLRAIAAVQDAISDGATGILGVHLEGPFLSHDKPGIHDPTAIRAMNERDVEALTAADAGVVLLTVAPENLPNGVLTRLTAAGVRVFAGHTDTSADQIRHAQDEGLAGVTHLFNAMSQMTGREPGVAWATVASDILFAGIIVDGHHVDWRNLATTARLMPDRLCLVTDAMLTLAGEATGFELHGVTITLADGRLSNAEGRLASAHISMIDSVRNMIAQARCRLPEALRMVTINPARALGMEADLVTLRADGRASFTCLDHKLDVAAVMIDGQFFDETMM